MITITFDASWWLILVFVFDLVVRVLAIIFVPRNRRPTAAMAWLLAIYFIPLIGVFLASFFSFSLCLRYYNYVALTINTPSTGDADPLVALSSDYLERAASHFTFGMRGYYLAVPLALWLFGPLWLLAGAIALTVALHRHDHAA